MTTKKPTKKPTKKATTAKKPTTKPKPKTAGDLAPGDEVRYNGRRCRVVSIGARSGDDDRVAVRLYELGFGEFLVAALADAPFGD